MELNYLKEFVTLAEILHYGEAAEKLYLSPSALTRHIQAIEKDLGTTLFRRTTKQVELTDMGRAFLPYAQQLAATQQRFLDELFIKPRRETRLLIGSTGTLALFRGPIFRFQQKHSGVVVEYHQVTPPRALELLRTDLLDFCFMEEKFLPYQEFHSVVCNRDHYVAVLSRAHPLAARESLQLAELAQTHLFLSPALADNNSLFMAQCRKAGFFPDYSVTEKNDAMDLALVSGGVAILGAREAAYFTDDTMKAVDILPHIQENMTIAYRKHSELSPLEEAFLAHILEESDV